jgi:hypothetical protein
MKTPEQLKGAIRNMAARRRLHVKEIGNLYKVRERVPPLSYFQFYQSKV